MNAINSSKNRIAIKEKEKIYLSSPHMGGNEQVFVKEAFDTNWIAPLGPNVDNFEKDLQNFTNVKHCSGFIFRDGCNSLRINFNGCESG